MSRDIRRRKIKEFDLVRPISALQNLTIAALQKNLDNLKTQIESINTFRTTALNFRFAQREGEVKKSGSDISMMRETMRLQSEENLLEEMESLTNTEVNSEELLAVKMTRYYQQIVNEAADKYAKLAIKENPSEDDKSRLIDAAAILELRLQWYSALKNPTQPELTSNIFVTALDNIKARRKNGVWDNAVNDAKGTLTVGESNFYEQIQIAVNEYNRLWNEGIERIRANSSISEFTTMSVADLTYTITEIEASAKFCLEFQNHLKKNPDQNSVIVNEKKLSDLIAEQEEELIQTKDKLATELAIRLATHFSSDPVERNLGYLRGSAVRVMLQNIADVRPVKDDQTGKEYRLIPYLKSTTIAATAQSRPEERFSAAFSESMEHVVEGARSKNETPLAVAISALTRSTLPDHVIKKLNDSMKALPIPMQYDSRAKVFILKDPKIETKTGPEKLAMLKSKYVLNGGSEKAWKNIIKGTNNDYEEVVKKLKNRVKEFGHRSGATFKTLVDMEKTIITSADAEENKKIDFVKRVYLSHASIFNTSVNEIFSNDKSYQDILLALETEAKRFGKGASSKTLEEIKNIEKGYDPGIANKIARQHDFSSKITTQIAEINVALLNTVELKNKLKENEVTDAQLCTDPYWKTFLNDTVRLKSLFENAIKTCNEVLQTTSDKRLINYYKEMFESQQAKFEEFRTDVARKLRDHLLVNLTNANADPTQAKKLEQESRELLGQMESLSPDTAKQFIKRVMGTYHHEITEELENYFQRNGRYDELTPSKAEDILYSHRTNLSLLTEICTTRLSILDGGVEMSEHIQFITALITTPTIEIMNGFENTALQPAYREWMNSSKSADECFTGVDKEDNPYYKLAKSAEAITVNNANNAESARDFVKNLSGKILLEIGTDVHVKISLCCDPEMSMVDTALVEPAASTLLVIFSNGTQPIDNVSFSDLSKMIRYLAIHEKPPKTELKKVFDSAKKYIEDKSGEDNLLTFQGQTSPADILISLAHQCIIQGVITQKEGEDFLLLHLEKRIGHIFNRDGQFNASDEAIIKMLPKDQVAQFIQGTVQSVFSGNQNNFDRNLPIFLRMLQYCPDNLNIKIAVFQANVNKLLAESAEENIQKIIHLVKSKISLLCDGMQGDEQTNFKKELVQRMVKLMKPYELNQPALDVCVTIILDLGTPSQQAQAIMLSAETYYKLFADESHTFGFDENESDYFSPKFQVLTELMDKINKSSEIKPIPIDKHRSIRAIGKIYDELSMLIMGKLREPETKELLVSQILTEKISHLLSNPLNDLADKYRDAAYFLSTNVNETLADRTSIFYWITESLKTACAEQNGTFGEMAVALYVYLTQFNEGTPIANNIDLKLIRQQVFDILVFSNDSSSLNYFLSKIENIPNPFVLSSDANSTENEFSNVKLVAANWLLQNPDRYGASPEAAAELKSIQMSEHFLWLEKFSSGSVTDSSESSMAWIRSVAMNPKDLLSIIHGKPEDLARLLDTLLQFYQNKNYELRLVSPIVPHLFLLSDSLFKEMEKNDKEIPADLLEQFQLHTAMLVKIKKDFTDEAKKKLAIFNSPDLKTAIRGILFSPSPDIVNAYNIFKQFGGDDFSRLNQVIQASFNEPNIIRFLSQASETELKNINKPLLSALLGEALSQKLLDMVKDAHDIGSLILLRRTDDAFQKYRAVPDEMRPIVNHVIEQTHTKMIKGVLEWMRSNISKKRLSEHKILELVTLSHNPKALSDIQAKLIDLGTETSFLRKTPVAMLAQTVLAEIASIERGFARFNPNVRIDNAQNPLAFLPQPPQARAVTPAPAPPTTPAAPTAK